MAAAPKGTYAAMTDQEEHAPGAALLYTTAPFTATPGQELSFRYWVNNRHIDWITPATFAHEEYRMVEGDWSGAPNHQALAYISTAVPSLADYPAAGSVLFRPAPGDPLLLPPEPANAQDELQYGTLAASLDPWAGQSIYIVFAQATTFRHLHFGVDNVTVICAE